MYCKHCFHWDKASETFNTEIESCCDCGYIKFPRLNNAEEAVARVRELHKPYFDEPYLKCSGCLDEDTLPNEYPCQTIQALDGANSSLDDVQTVSLDGEQ